jgi:hypothetical protein
MANIQPSGWSDDGHANNNDDKGDAPLQYDDDAWQNDGWSSNNLDQGSSYASTEVQNGKSTPVWPFLVAALVAGVIGAMFVVSRRKRRLDQEEHPLDGAVKKRQRLFAGMSKKKGALVEDFDNEEETRPNFIEISERKESYKSPQCDDSI